MTRSPSRTWRSTSGRARSLTARVLALTHLSTARRSSGACSRRPVLNAHPTNARRMSRIAFAIRTVRMGAEATHQRARVDRPAADTAVSPIGMQPTKTRLNTSCSLISSSHSPMQVARSRRLSMTGRRRSERGSVARWMTYPTVLRSTMPLSIDTFQRCWLIATPWVASG